jgi:subtilisin family serine protease
MYPAAFTPWPGGPVTQPDPKFVPVVSVGALNPNRTVAMFSNAGGWVACHRRGAAVVSTFPRINGSAQATASTVVDGVRATIDPDDFTAGFAVWSGTSFAGPALAGEIAAALCQADLDSCERTVVLERGWSALSAQVGTLHR